MDDLGNILAQLNPPGSQEQQGQIGELGQSLMNTPAPGNQQQDLVTRALEEMRIKEEQTRAATHQWHGFIDNVKNNPTFGKALAVLGAALSSPGNFSTNLGRGALGVQQIFDQERDRTQADVDRNRSQTIAELGLKSQAMGLDQTAQNQVDTKKIAGANLLDSQTKQRLDTTKAAIDILYKDKDYKLNQGRLGMEGQRLILEGSRLANEGKVQEAQIAHSKAAEAVAQQALEDAKALNGPLGMFQIDKNDNPLAIAAKSAGKASYQEQLQKAQANGTVDPVVAQRLAGDAFTNAYTETLNNTKLVSAIKNVTNMHQQGLTQNAKLETYNKFLGALTDMPGSFDTPEKQQKIQEIATQMTNAAVGNLDLETNQRTAERQATAEEQKAFKAKYPGHTLVKIVGNYIHIKDDKTGEEIIQQMKGTK